MNNPEPLFPPEELSRMADKLNGLNLPSLDGRKVTVDGQFLKVANEVNHLKLAAELINLGVVLHEPVDVLITPGEDGSKFSPITMDDKALLALTAETASKILERAPAATTTLDAHDLRSRMLRIQVEDGPKLALIAHLVGATRATEVEGKVKELVQNVTQDEQAKKDFGEWHKGFTAGEETGVSLA